IRQQLRGAINLLVHVGRLADGRRKALSIAERTGFDDQTISWQEVFVSEATGGAVPGRTRLTPTGIRPQMMDRIYQRGIEVPELSRLFPKNPAAIADSGRRPTAVAPADGGFPTHDRRQNYPPATASLRVGLAEPAAPGSIAASRSIAPAATSSRPRAPRPGRERPA